MSKKKKVVNRATLRTLDFPFKREQRNESDFVLPPLSTQVCAFGFHISKARIVSQDTNTSVFFPFHLRRKIIKKGAVNCVQADSSVR